MWLGLGETTIEDPEMDRTVEKRWGCARIVVFQKFCFFLDGFGVCGYAYLLA
jgi:hypothetical protein